MGKGCCGDNGKCSICGCKPCRCDEKAEKGSCCEKCGCREGECECKEKKANW